MPRCDARSTLASNEPMAILDRLLPAWRHSDPEVRVVAVRELGDDERDTLAAVAQRDEDPRVRREAIRRLDDVEVLASIAAEDGDEQLRALATARRGDLHVAAAISGAAVDACLRALAQLDRPAQQAAVAARAAHREVRDAALAAITEEAALAEVARRTRSVDTGSAAVVRIRDALLLRRIASGNPPAEVAVAAVERIDDPEILHALAHDRQAQRAVRKHARALLERTAPDDHPVRVAERSAQRDALIADVEALHDADDPDAATAVVRKARASWASLEAHGAADDDRQQRFRRACDAAFARIAWAARRHEGAAQAPNAHADEISERERLCAQVESLSGPDTPQRMDEAVAAWQRLGRIEDVASLDLAARFEAAVERCRERHRRWESRQAFHERVAELVDDAEALVGRGDAKAAAKRRAGLERRWRQLADSAAGKKWLADERDLQRRFDEAGAALERKEEARRARRERRENEARQQATTLAERLEGLCAAPSIKRGAADRAIDAVAEALRALRYVPAEEREVLRQRLEAGRELLARRFSAESTSEEWKRWANVDAQRELIDRAEALLASDDPARMLAEGAALDRDWKRFAAAPRKESQANWDRFRNARNEIRRRTDAYLAANLAQKEALCAAAEELAESTDWRGTADRFKQLQAEWKKVGPIPRKQADALFRRFRAPANAYFERRNGVMSERRERWEERIGQLRSLAEAATALADSDDWDTTAAEIKRLQAEWRNLHPRGGEDVQAVAATFRAACDRFFERYRRRDEIELEARAEHLADVVERVEALRAAVESDSPPPISEVAPQLQEALTEWARRGMLPAERSLELESRIQAACAAIEAGCEENLEDHGLEVATAVAQREKICAKLERLVESFRKHAAQEEAMDLGARLRLAMAANTIGGSSAPPREQALRDDVAAAEKLHERWERLAPVVGPSARALVPRFAMAWARIDALRREHGLG